MSRSGTSRATTEQKQQGHEIFNTILQQIGIFGGTEESNKIILSRLYRFWAAVLSDTIDIDGVIDPYRGDNHFARISKENASKVHSFFDALFQHPQVRGEIGKISELLQEWEQQLQKDVLNQNHIGETQRKANKWLKENPKGSEKYQEVERQIQQWINKDHLAIYVQNYIKTNLETDIEGMVLEPFSSSASNVSAQPKKKIKQSTAQDYFIDGLIAEINRDDKATKLYDMAERMGYNANKESANSSVAENSKTPQELRSNILFRKGIILYKKSKLEEAMKCIEKSSELGNVEAKHILGIFYLIKKDEGKAIELLIPLAEQGHSNSQYVLGKIYELRNDSKQEVKWLSLAAAQNHPHAQNNLGVCYRDGLGVKKNEKRAFELFTKAANNGQLDAKVSLGDFYLEGKDFVNADLERAIELYTEVVNELQEKNNLYYLALLRIESCLDIQNLQKMNKRFEEVKKNLNEIKSENIAIPVIEELEEIFYKISNSANALINPYNPHNLPSFSPPKIPQPIPIENTLETINQFVAEYNKPDCMADKKAKIRNFVIEKLERIDLAQLNDKQKKNITEVKTSLGSDPIATHSSSAITSASPSVSTPSAATLSSKNEQHSH